jgi:hypothetical protein
MTTAPTIGGDLVAPSPEAHVAPRQPRGTPYLLPVVAVLSSLFVLLYLYVALHRIGHPFELEWMEGGVLGHVDRVRQGQAIYTAPSLSFVPYLYTPAYYWVAAGCTFLLGDDFLSLRVVSVVASLALLWGIASLTHRDSWDRWTPLLAVGLFAACFEISGAWLDLAREDSLCLALLVGGLAVARRLPDASGAPAARRAVGAAALLALACLTKQVALLPALAAVVFVALRGHRRTAVVLGGSLAAVLVGAGTVLQLSSHGWFVRYVVLLPSRHEVARSEVAGFFTHDLLVAVPIVLGLAVLGLLACWRSERDAFAFHALVGTAMVACAWLARLHTGGYDNVLLPAYAELSVLAAIGAARTLRSRRPMVPAGVALLVAVQLALLAYDPRPMLPSIADRQAGEQVLAGLRALPGPVYLPGHPSYAVAAGFPATTQSAALEDVLRAPGDGTDVMLATELSDAVAQQRFGAIVVDSAWGLSYLPDDLCRYYRPDHELLPAGDPRLEPVTGTITRPDVVWLRRDDTTGPDCSAGGGSPGDRP